jgi:hypothetical protein
MDKKDLKQDKKMIASAVHKHEKRLHQGASPTKLKKGGVTTDMMMSMGRNMARAKNQGSK